MNTIDSNQNNIKINYKKLTINAMKKVIYEVLKSVSKGGLPDNHHFYISFDTCAIKTKIPKDLKTKFPEQMTIVIQNSFWDLKVDKNGFSIILSFNNIKSKLEITFDSILSFSDPHANFILNFPKSINKNELLEKTKNDKSSKVIDIKDFKKDN